MLGEEGPDLAPVRLGLGGSSNVRAIRATYRRNGWDNRAVPLGVYVHIPFCADRCDYCDFATWTDRGHLIDDYVDACVADAHRQMTAIGRPSTSVFFGGGTPSLIPADGLARILDAIPRAPGAEVTVECNPDSVEPEQLATYAAAGVNRLSLGVQSLRRTCSPSLAAPTTRLRLLARSGRPAPPASSTSTWI